MEDITEYKARVGKGVRRADTFLLGIGRKLTQLFSEYRYFIAVMLLGLVIWVVVFNIALTDYLGSSSWRSRSVWLGPFPDPGEFNLFGYTILYQFEGYSDYSFFYVHWGYNMLNGVMPYTDSFGYLAMDGITNQNGIFMFPPLTAYLYAAGIWLGDIIGPGNWGIGFLLAALGYLTALPVYGIAKELSKNPRVGEIAAFTYLLNPLVLYHIDYLWLNPSAFYFFFFAGFYALVKRHNHLGIILIVSAALFKQTAWFLGIPLVIYLLLRAREKKEPISETVDDESIVNTESPEKTEEDKESEDQIEGMEIEKNSPNILNVLLDKLHFVVDYFDFRGFLVSVIVAVAFAGAIMFPILIAQPHFWNYWRVALGHFSFNGNFTDLPGYSTPESLPVLAILFKKPELAKTMESILVSGGPLIFGVLVFSGLMLLGNKWEGEENLYLRRILFFTLLLMLWVNLTGPRGVYKYYFTMFGPFFSIFSSARMTRSQGDVVPVSLTMFLVPFAFALLILIPDRNIYLLYILLIFIVYLFTPVIDRLYDIVKRPFRYLHKIISKSTDFGFETISLEYQPIPSRLLRSLELTTILTSIIAGISLLIVGFTITFSHVTDAIPIILQYFVLTGVMLFLGTQLLSIGINGLLPSEERRRDLNYVLKTLSYSITTILFGYGLFTYLSNWSVDLDYARIVMVLSSTMMVMWTFSLIIKIKIHLRFLVNIFLLMAIGLAMWIWSVLGNSIMFLFGLASLIGLVVYMLLTIISLLSSFKNYSSDTTQGTFVAETIAE